LNKQIYAGIDFGGKRTGLAVCDESCAFVIPCGVFGDYDALAAKIREKKVKALVIGWPLRLDGSKGLQCEEVEKMQKKLLKLIDLPCFFQDERFSSKAYSNISGVNDDLSAKWILEAFINSQVN